MLLFPWFCRLTTPANIPSGMGATARALKLDTTLYEEDLYKFLPAHGDCRVLLSNGTNKPRFDRLYINRQLKFSVEVGRCLEMVVRGQRFSASLPQTPSFNCTTLVFANALGLPGKHHAQLSLTALHYLHRRNCAATQIVLSPYPQPSSDGRQLYRIGIFRQPPQPR